VPFLHVSTDYVFDGAGTRAWRPDDETAPLGAYGRSKLAGEIGVNAAGGKSVILRTSWVFSAHGSNFVKTMLRLSSSRDQLSVVSDQIGGPTAAQDIASALISMARALQAGSGRPGIYHFSGTPDVSWADFAREIFRQSGRSTKVLDIPSQAYPTPARRPNNSRLDCQTTEAVFGIQRPDWRASLTKVLRELGELA
jgi:dTDP-4-dehydrorhamnose reductase